MRKRFYPFFYFKFLFENFKIYKHFFFNFKQIVINGYKVHRPPYDVRLLSIVSFPLKRPLNLGNSSGQVLSHNYVCKFIAILSCF